MDWITKSATVGKPLLHPYIIHELSWLSSFTVIISRQFVSMISRSPPFKLQTAWVSKSTPPLHFSLRTRTSSLPVRCCSRQKLDLCTETLEPTVDWSPSGNTAHLEGTRNYAEHALTLHNILLADQLSNLFRVYATVICWLFECLVANIIGRVMWLPRYREPAPGSSTCNICTCVVGHCRGAGVNGHSYPPVHCL